MSENLDRFKLFTAKEKQLIYKVLNTSLTLDSLIKHGSINPYCGYQPCSMSEYFELHSLLKEMEGLMRWNHN